MALVRAQEVHDLLSPAQEMKRFHLAKVDTKLLLGTLRRLWQGLDEIKPLLTICGGNDLVALVLEFEFDHSPDVGFIVYD